MRVGKVYLVGAGPGDPGLVTHKGLQCLGGADVVVYDRLLDDRLLAEVSPEAERIYAGKASSEHSREQDEINRILVDKAREGKTVVRLKGGDPFVLGRGGEEAESLADNHIPFEVVPGVSSAIAAPAYAGIPVTHRAAASSFAVVTGHEDPGKAGSSIAWDKLATGVDTLVFLMGMQNLDEIAIRLMRHGRSADTPVAVIKDGTRPEQQTLVSSLQEIAARVKERGIGPPAVIVIGEVVKMREKLRWFDNRPLFGKRVLVTRARRQASALSQLLSERGARPIELPAIGIERVSDTSELDRAIANLSQYQWIVFTSANGVEAFFERLRSMNLDARALRDVSVGAIGAATALSLERRGITADYCPTVFTSEALVTGLGSRNVSAQRFLLPRADIADRQLTQGLIELGAIVDEVAVYRTVSPSGSLTAKANRPSLSGIDIITFTSASTVSNLVAALGGEVRRSSARIACIGPKTAEAATGAGLRVDILASKQTIGGLVQAIEDYLSAEG